MVVHTQPGVLVAEVPEGDILDDVGVLAEYLEQTGILVFLQSADIGGLWLCLTTGETQLSTALRIGTEVELGDVDDVDDLLEAVDGLLKLLLVGEVDIVVALHADTVDGHTSVLHLLHHVVDTFTLAVVHAAVVVVDQHTCGICLTGELKGLGDELVTAELEMTALTIGAGRNHLAIDELERTAVVGHSLIHHVPGIDHVFITIHHCVDMLAQTLVEHFLLHRLALLVGEHPVGKLRVPAEAVATHLDAVLAAEVGDAVG